MVALLLPLALHHHLVVVPQLLFLLLQVQSFHHWPLFVEEVVNLGLRLAVASPDVILSFGLFVIITTIICHVLVVDTIVVCIELVLIL